jgi:hypothetical protein
MLRAVVIETDTTGAKSVRDIFEHENRSQENLLRYVKRRLVSNPPHNRHVEIQITDPTTDSNAVTKQWTVPDAYQG